MQIVIARLVRPAVLVLTAALLALATIAAANWGRDGEQRPLHAASPNGTSLNSLALLAWPTLVPTPVPPTATPTPEPTTAPAYQPPATVFTAQPREWADAGYAAQVLAYVNAQRSAAGLSPLVPNAGLTAAAQRYAGTLLALGYLSHSGDGGDAGSRASAAGYAWAAIGEALWSGTGPLGPERVVSDWMGSPPHRDIILSPAYREAGVGCYFREGGPKAVCDLIVGG